MDVKFITTDSVGLPEVEVANGQLICLSDVDEMYYDMGNERRLVSGTRLVSSLPSEGQDGIIYIILTTDGRAVLSVWDSTNEVFKNAGTGAELLEITAANYKLLPAAKKTADYIYFVTDATSMDDLT